MVTYEALLILPSNLNEEARKGLFAQLDEAVTKNGGELTNSGVWAEKKRLGYAIKKNQEGLYYLMNFKIAPGAIEKLKAAYRLNENVIRMMVVKVS